VLLTMRIGVCWRTEFVEAKNKILIRRSAHASRL
jgi:hypothetical protein